VLLLITFGDGIALGNFPTASRIAIYAAEMQAVRVPPSACKTWQSTANVCGPILFKSIAARNDLPINL
jgi:hypothetical protein